VIVVSFRLLELGDAGPHGRAVAQLLARTQVLQERHLGHILDYSRPGTWAAIRRCCKHGYTQDVVVECLRCGAPARIAEWASSAQCAKAGLPWEGTEVRGLHHARLRDVYTQCTGGRAATMLAATNVVDTEG